MQQPRRAAIVSISASDCRIDAAIHKSLAIAADDAEPRWCFVGGAAAAKERDVFAQISRPGDQQALGPGAISSKQR